MNSILLTADADWTRLFDLDFQLLHDSVLTLIAVFVLFLVASVFFFKPFPSSLFIHESPGTFLSDSFFIY